MSFALRKKPVKQYRGNFVYRDRFGKPLWSVRVGVYGLFYQCRFIPEFCFLAGGSYYWVKWVDFVNFEIGIVRCGPPAPSILITLTFDQFYNNFFIEVA